MTYGSEDCLKCEEHKAWEERMKVLDKVPSMLSWMNYMKGALAVITAIIVVAFPVFYSHIMTIRSETARAMEKQDENIKQTRDTLATQVALLAQNAATISRDVAVFVAKSELRQDSISGELAAIKQQRSGAR